MTKEIANGIISGIRCLPAHSLIFWVPAAPCVLLYPCCCHVARCPLPPATHPPWLPRPFEHSWYCCILKHFDPLFSTGCQDSWNNSWSSCVSGLQVIPHLMHGTTYKFGFACAALITQPYPCMMLDARHEIPAVWNMQISHEIFSARSSSLPGTYRPEYFPEKLRSSVEKECGKAEIWAAQVGVIWTMPGSLCLLLELLGLLLDSSTCSSGASTCTFADA